MSKKKKIVIAVVAVSVLLLLIGGFIAWRLLRGETIAKAENTYEMDYHSYCTYEHDSNIKIDGVLDEEEWQGKKWYTNTYRENLSGKYPTLRVTAFSTEKGVYIASVVEDTNLRNNGQRAPKVNSNWKIGVTADNVGQERSCSGIYRIGMNIDMRGENFGPYQNFDRAVKVDGELNSENTKSATLEIFVPWETLRIDTSLGIPETFRILPSYCAVFPGSAEIKEIGMISTTAQTQDYYVFNKDGYRDVDREGAVLGNTSVGWSKSGNWDISKEAEGVVRSSSGTEHHQIFFTGTYGRDFVVETTMTFIKPLENQWPKAGIIFRGADANWYTVYVNLMENLVEDSGHGTKNVTKVLLTTVDQNWKWRDLSTVQFENTAKVKDEVKLTVMKYGNTFHYFVNDIYLASEEMSFMNIDVFPGFYALGCDVIYKNSSCKELTPDMVKKYLNKEGVYLIEEEVVTTGGLASVDKMTVKKGESYKIYMNTKSGYEVSSILINGKEHIKDARQKAKGGVYVVENVQGNQEIRVSFAECKGNSISGTLTDGKTNLAATLAVESKTNGTLHYDIEGSGNYSIVLPKGTYEMKIKAEGYETQVITVEVKGNVVKNINLPKSEFPKSVEMNGKNYQTGRWAWNLDEAYKKVVTSNKNGNKLPLFFEGTTKDFVVESKIEYTTEFTEGESAYQPDLMGGFRFASKDKEGWVVVRESGIVYTGWKWDYSGGLYSDVLLRYPTKKSVKFTFAKVGADAYLYFNDKLVLKTEWNKLTDGIGAKDEVLVGLYFVADKTANIRFSNYSLKKGTAVAKQYIDSHGNGYRALPENPMFTEGLNVGGVHKMSKLGVWNLSQASKGIFSTSKDANGKLSPLFFTEHGSTALMHATIEYTTKFTGDASQYQPDLWGGFAINDGTHSGFIMACQSGIVTGDWTYRMGLVPYSILHYPDKRKVDLTVALQGDYFHVFMDGKYVSKIRVSWAVPGAKAGSDMAFGLYMLADKTADIRFSNVSITTDAAAVDNYIKQNR